MSATKPLLAERFKSWFTQEQARYGRSQAEQARILGIDPTHVSRYFKGDLNVLNVIHAFMNEGGDAIWLLTGKRQGESFAPLSKDDLTMLRYLADNNIVSLDQLRTTLNHAALYNQVFDGLSGTVKHLGHLNKAASRPNVRIVKSTRPSRPDTLRGLPLFDMPAAAGSPMPDAESLAEIVDLNAFVSSKNPHAVFLTPVIGDSMMNAGIFDGDKVVVDASLDLKKGKIIVGILNGGPLVKRAAFADNGNLVLLSENPRYAPLEVQSPDTFTYCGTVRYSLHAFD